MSETIMNAETEAPNAGSAQLLAEIKELKATLACVEQLMRISIQPVLEARLFSIFESGKEIRAFELSNGVRSTREIGRMVGVDQKTISTWWRKWERRHGIVERVGARGQFRSKYALIDLMVRANSKIGAPARHPTALAQVE